MLSNVILPNLLAQTTLPTESVSTSMQGLLFALFAGGAMVSANVIASRKLYDLPEMPPPANRSVFTGLLLATLSAFLSLMVLVGLMGGDPSTSAGKRLAIMMTPGAQLGAFGFMVALMRHTGWLEQVWCWRPRLRRKELLAAAVGANLLVLPWVLLCGTAIEALARYVQIKTPKEHVIFELWKQDGAGISLFKAMACVSAIIGAPLIEELFFRGLLQRLLAGMLKSPAVAIVLTSLAFAAIHQPWTLQPPVFVLSLVLGWAYFRTGNLALPILIHALFNALQVVLFIFVNIQ